jgi:hypothetical protein
MNQNNNKTKEIHIKGSLPSSTKASQLHLSLPNLLHIEHILLSQLQ